MTNPANKDRCIGCHYTSTIDGDHPRFCLFHQTETASQELDRLKAELNMHIGADLDIFMYYEEQQFLEEKKKALLAKHVELTGKLEACRDGADDGDDLPSLSSIMSNPTMAIRSVAEIRAALETCCKDLVACVEMTLKLEDKHHDLTELYGTNLRAHAAYTYELEMRVSQRSIALAAQTLHNLHSLYVCVTLARPSPWPPKSPCPP